LVVILHLTGFKKPVRCIGRRLAMLIGKLPWRKYTRHGGKIPAMEEKMYVMEEINQPCIN